MPRVVRLAAFFIGSVHSRGKIPLVLQPVPRYGLLIDRQSVLCNFCALSSTERAMNPPSKLTEIFASREFHYSIEIFPPKTPQGDTALFESLDRLAELGPSFMTCTYGAGGSTQDRTIELCCEIQSRYQLPAMAHFTCVASTKEELLDWLRRAEAASIPNIMALRGDPPKGETTFQQIEGGLRYANELVELIKGHYPNFDLGVAAYPEVHQEATDEQSDLDNLKRKIDAGGSVAFTQLFYDNSNFFRFRERYDAAGITAPLVPGIMPITNYKRIQRITAMCGAIFPEELSSKLAKHQDDPQAEFEIGVEHAIEQCRELIEQGAPGIHFYALNKSQACERIILELGLSPAQV